MSEVRVIESMDDGFTWIGKPEESMKRASHAIGGESGVWLVDPVDGPGLGGVLEEWGGVGGIVVTLDRHTRDAVALARTFDVAVALAPPLSGLELDVEVCGIEEFCVDTGWEWHNVFDRRGWHEIALSGGDVVFVSESLGTVPHFLAPGERLGVHPLVRWVPPREQLGRLKAETVLVGHGEPILEDGVGAMTAALRDARRRIPGAYWGAMRSMIGR